MPVRRTLAAVAVALLSLLPITASAAMVSKWQVTTNFRVIADLGDFNGDGVYKIITGEVSGGGEKIAVRSGITGAILAQTALVYQGSDFQFVDIDSDGNYEIMFLDALTGKLNCLDYTTGSGTLAVRWSIVPQGQPATLFFADFDGNGHLFFVLTDVGTDPNYYIYDRNGVLFSTINPPGPTTSGWQVSHRLEDYDSDGRQELLFDYHNGSSNPGADMIYLYENNSPPAAVMGDASAPHSIELSSSFPNPTSSASRIEFTLPNSGPASLRLYDVTGRQVRTLLDGNMVAGRHEAIWDGRDGTGRTLPAGAYFYELSAGGQRVLRQVIHLR
jgi:FlgD Ig-like domain